MAYKAVGAVPDEDDDLPTSAEAAGHPLQHPWVDVATGYSPGSVSVGVALRQVSRLRSRLGLCGTKHCRRIDLGGARTGRHTLSNLTRFRREPLGSVAHRVRVGPGTSTAARRPSAADHRIRRPRPLEIDERDSHADGDRPKV